MDETNEKKATEYALKISRIRTEIFRVDNENLFLASQLSLLESWADDCTKIIDENIKLRKERVAVTQNKLRPPTIFPIQNLIVQETFPNPQITEFSAVRVQPPPPEPIPKEIITKEVTVQKENDLLLKRIKFPDVSDLSVVDVPIGAGLGVYIPLDFANSLDEPLRSLLIQKLRPFVSKKRRRRNNRDVPKN